MKSILELLEKCQLCPRQCSVNRLKGQRGYCGVGEKVIIAHYGTHHGEEPPISGARGSGTIFFSFCNLRCVFCQNHQISHGGIGQDISTEELTEIILTLQTRGCHNINLVSPTPYVPHIATAIREARSKGLTIPIVYNTNAYESVEALQMLAGLIDIYLPDFKYWSPVIAEKLSGIPKGKPYPEFAKDALLEMKRQVGDLVIEDGIAKKGLLLRHLVLPNGLAGSKEIFKWVAGSLGTGTFISLMSQYYPTHEAYRFPLLKRRIRPEEYSAVTEYLVGEGFENVFIQDIESAPLFVPDFENDEPFAADKSKGHSAKGKRP
ncbi:MAG: radical SAM protein [Syntrophus sp. (in: bacteria)]|nr:radical SAM protein [Syntrophus sp. (in: bacteria)]